MIKQITNRLSAADEYRTSMKVFCKSLVVYTILKVLLSWPVMALVVQYKMPHIPDNIVVRIALSPLVLARDHVNLFNAGSILFLTVVLFLRWNTIVSVLFFLLTLNLWWMNFAMGNGSDLVLVMLSFWTMWIIPYKNDDSNARLLTSFAIVMLQIQVAVIYFASGWDKLMSAAWRSGDAFESITHLDFMIRADVYGTLLNPLWQQIFTVSAITFQLAFSVLIWFSRTRVAMLVMGVVFHIVIAVFLNLPDFSLLMILSYLVYCRDEDFKSVGSLLKGLRQP